MFTPASLIAAATSARAPGLFSTSMTRSTAIYRAASAYSPSGVRCRGRPVLIVAHVLAPRDRVAVVAHLLHRDVRHKAVRSGAVPVVLARLEEHAVTGADHLHRSA